MSIILSKTSFSKYFFILLIFLFLVKSIYGNSNNVLNTDISTNYENQKIFSAIESNDNKTLKQLIKSADVNTRDKLGFTPLHKAVILNNTDAVKTLLKSKNININAKLPEGANATLKNGKVIEASGMTALHLASINAYIKSLNMLLQKKANASEKDYVNFALPVHLAAYSGSSDAVNSILKNRYVNNLNQINIRDRYMRTPLMYSAMNYGSPAMRYLINNGADVNAYDNNNWRALHYASYLNDYDGVQTLLDEGANPYVYNSDGLTPYELATDERVKNLYNPYY